MLQYSLHRDNKQISELQDVKVIEAFIRCSYLPATELIGGIIDEHGHLMEPVPVARVKENGYGIRGRLRKTIFLHSRSFRPSGIAFARLIVCRLRRSRGVDTISFLKKERGGSLRNR